MPLNPKATVGENIREFHTGPTFAHTKAKFGKKRAQAQAIAVAMATARRSAKKADGGEVPDWNMSPSETDIEAANKAALDKDKKKALGGPNLSMEGMVMHGSMYGLRHEGMIHSSVPGRTDKLPMNVPSGSYVLPADIPSALGQGNSLAGGQILKKMFSSGPYGMSPMKSAGRSGMAYAPRLSMPRPRTKFAEGGDADEADAGKHVPIVAAGGEYLIHPDVVRDIGHGDIKAGHRVLDKFVLNVRGKNIKTLKKLPGPKA